MGPSCWNRSSWAALAEAGRRPAAGSGQLRASRRQGGSAALRRSALRAALWLGAPLARTRQQSSDKPWPEWRDVRMRIHPESPSSQHDCPSRNRRVKGALRASLHDRHSPTLDPAAVRKGIAAIRKAGTRQDAPGWTLNAQPRGPGAGGQLWQQRRQPIASPSLPSAFRFSSTEACA